MGGYHSGGPCPSISRWKSYGSGLKSTENASTLRYTATIAGFAAGSSQCYWNCRTRKAERQSRSTQSYATQKGTRQGFHSRRVDDPWQLLGLKAGASAGDIRQAFRTAARETHPDVGGDPDKFQRLCFAYDEALAAANGEPQHRCSGPSAEPLVRKQTLADLLEWRRSQRDEHNTRKEARRRAREQVHVESRYRRRPRSISQDEMTTMPYKDDLARNTLEEASLPSAREAWVREFAMDGLSTLADTAGNPCLEATAGGTEGDALVGHRTVRGTVGYVKVPVHESASGARYYISPLTAKQVRVPR